MTLWAKRTDGNHAEIRQAMRDAGAEVEDLSGSGKGMPDTLVWTPHTGLMLVEIKMPKGTLTAHQVRFHARFPVHIVRSVDDAMELIKIRQFRRLEMGEIVLATDEIYDDHKREWVEPTWSVGKPAPDPDYTSHRQFRREIIFLPNAIGEARADSAT